MQARLSDINKNIQETVLPNGVTVVTCAVESAEKLYVELSLRAGSVYDEPGQTDTAHFLEHMIGYKLDRLYDITFDEQYISLGADYNFLTGDTQVSYYCYALEHKSRQYLQDVIDGVFFPEFSAEDVEKEKGPIHNELDLKLNNPMRQERRKLLNATFPDSPYGVEPLHSHLAVEAMSVAQLMQFHQKHYHAANTMIYAVGNVNHEEFCASCMQDTNAIPIGEGLNMIKRVEPQPCDIITKNKSVDLCTLKVMFKVAGDNDFRKQVIDQCVLSCIYQWLYLELRNNQHLAYSVSREAYGKPNSSNYIGFGIRVKKDSVKQVYEAFFDVVEGMHRVSEKDLEAFVAVEKERSAEIFYQSLKDYAQTVVYNHFYGIEYSHEERMDIVDNLTPEKIMARFKEIIQTPSIVEHYGDVPNKPMTSAELHRRLCAQFDVRPIKEKLFRRHFKL
jgi:predicted Zn-dependent peptidase